MNNMNGKKIVITLMVLASAGNIVIALALSGGSSAFWAGILFMLLMLALNPIEPEQEPSWMKILRSDICRKSLMFVTGVFLTAIMGGNQMLYGAVALLCLVVLTAPWWRWWSGHAPWEVTTTRPGSDAEGSVDGPPIGGLQDSPPSDDVHT